MGEELRPHVHMLHEQMKKSQKLKKRAVIRVMSRASFCCSKKMRELHLFSTKVAFMRSKKNEKVAFVFNESCIYAQTLQTTVVESSDYLHKY